MMGMGAIPSSVSIARLSAEGISPDRGFDASVTELLAHVAKSKL